MPHRIGFLWEKIISEENCIQAVVEMARHKSKNKMAVHIRENKECYGKELHEKLSTGTYQFHKTRNITIRDSYKGKTRDLQIPTLEDQTAQQAWIIVMIPYLMRRSYYYSCSSIPGAGTARAIHAVKKSMNKRKPPAHAAVTDIKKFYQSCPHWLVRRNLRRICKDEQVIDFASQCMRAMNPNGTGIAIGWPISPWLANLALTELDFRLREYYPDTKTVRYMDDIVILGPNRRRVKKAVRFLYRTLRMRDLRIKNTWAVRKTKHDGIQFLSYVFYPRHTLLCKELTMRIVRRMRRVKDNLSVHNARGVISYLGILKNMNGFHFRLQYVYPNVNPEQCRRMISHADNNNRRRNSETGNLSAA